MAATGGDIIEVTYNHPTLGGGTLFAKAGEDNTFDLGGIRSSDDVNMVDGAGQMIDQMNRARWNVEILIVNDMNTREDVEKVVALASDPATSDWTFSHINGAVYTGNGKPVGDLQLNVNQTTFKLKVGGGGKLKKQ
jgi:hypothetical protein